MKTGKGDERRISRRNFVKGTTVGAGAAALAGLGSMPAEAENRTEGVQPSVHECDVTVVGLGISGTGGRAPRR